MFPLRGTVRGSQLPYSIYTGFSRAPARVLIVCAESPSSSHLHFFGRFSCLFDICESSCSDVSVHFSPTVHWWIHISKIFACSTARLFVRFPFAFTRLCFLSEILQFKWFGFWFLHFLLRLTL